MTTSPPSSAAAVAASAAQPLAHRQAMVVFSGLVLVMLLAALDSTIVSTALPTIVTPIYGKLGDLYGRKIVLQSAVVLFLAGSVLCGLSFRHHPTN